MNKTYNVLDLFCGCGGMSKGLTDAGLNVIKDHFIKSVWFMFQ